MSEKIGVKHQSVHDFSPSL